MSEGSQIESELPVSQDAVWTRRSAAEVAVDGLNALALDLRQTADAAWEAEQKEWSTTLHGHARQVSAWAADLETRERLMSAHLRAG